MYPKYPIWVHIRVHVLLYPTFHILQLQNMVKLQSDESSSYNMVKFHNMVKLQCMNILNCVPWFHIPAQHGEITKHEYIELGSTVPHTSIPELETYNYTLLVTT